MPSYFYATETFIPGYTGPLFELQPIPGGQPTAFYQISEGVLNSESNGTGDSLADWVLANTNNPGTQEESPDYYYKSLFDQHGSVIKATAMPGQRPMMGGGFNPNQFMQANTPEFGFLTFAAKFGAGVSDEAI